MQKRILSYFVFLLLITVVTVCFFIIRPVSEKEFMFRPINLPRYTTFEPASRGPIITSSSLVQKTVDEQCFFQKDTVDKDSPSDYYLIFPVSLPIVTSLPFKDDKLYCDKTTMTGYLTSGENFMLFDDFSAQSPYFVEEDDYPVVLNESEDELIAFYVPNVSSSYKDEYFFTVMGVKTLTVGDTKIKVRIGKDTQKFIDPSYALQKGDTSYTVLKRIVTNHPVAYSQIRHQQARIEELLSHVELKEE